MFKDKKLIIIGFILLLTGVVLPFLMVIKIIGNSFLISFISYAASISGLVVGSIGAMMLDRQMILRQVLVMVLIDGQLRCTRG